MASRPSCFLCRGFAENLSLCDRCRRGVCMNCAVNGGLHHNTTHGTAFCTSCEESRRRERMALSQSLPMLDKSAWEPDSSREGCKQCARNFSLFNRRHHCRACGGLYCSTCLTEELLSDGKTHHVCGSCMQAASTRSAPPPPPLVQSID